MEGTGLQTHAPTERGRISQSVENNLCPVLIAFQSGYRRFGCQKCTTYSRQRESCISSQHHSNIFHSQNPCTAILERRTKKSVIGRLSPFCAGSTIIKVRGARIHYIDPNSLPRQR